MNRIAVYCASSAGGSNAFLAAASHVGQTLAQRNIGLVYGGASVGCMGALADAAMAAGGHVIGIIPQWMDGKEVAHHGITDLRLVESMHERKAMMAELADGFIALPGGYGTLEEVFEMLTWTQLRLQQKPIGLLDVNGFYRPLLAFLDGAVAAGLLKQSNRDLVLVDTDVALLLEKMANFEPPTSDKWALENRT